MIVMIGSKAGAFHGVEAQRADGKRRDTDLVATPETAQRFVAYLEARWFTVASERYPGMWLVNAFKGPGLFEIDATMRPSRQAILGLDNFSTAEIADGFPVRVISLAGQASLLEALKGLACWRETYAQDLNLYRAALKQRGEHANTNEALIATLVRAEATVRFGPSLSVLT